MSPFVLLFVTAFGMLAMAIAQLTSQCQFVRFSPGFEADDPISYTARCAKVPGGPFEICSELRLGHCFVNDDGHLGAPVSDDTASFTKSCPSCNVDSAGTAMFCICEALNTSYGYTSIDLGDYISINNGLLACSTTTARQVSECPVSWIGGPPRRRRRFVG